MTSLLEDSKCPISTPEDYVFLKTILKLNKNIKQLFLYSCDSLRSSTSEAISQVIEYPQLNEDSFFLILERFRKNDKEIKKMYKGLNKEKRFNSNLFFNTLIDPKVSGYQRNIDFQKTPIFKSDQEYLKNLIEVLIFLKAKNYLRVETIIERLIGMDAKRLNLELSFSKSFKDIFLKAYKGADLSKIDQKKVGMLNYLMKDLFPNLNNIIVYESVVDLRSQLKSYYGRTFPLYYLHILKQQISKNEKRDYAKFLLAKIEGSQKFNIEVLFELLKHLPRNKQLMKYIAQELGDFNELSVFESYLILKASENTVFRRFLVENMKSAPRAKFQLFRKIYLRLLKNKKTSVFALAKLWKAGDHNVMNIWNSVLLENQIENE